MTESATESGQVSRVALGEWLMLAAFIALGIFVYQQINGPLTAQGNASGDPVNNAALFPRLVANLILGLSALQLVQLLRRKVRLSAEFRYKATGDSAWRCLACFGMLLAYLFALPLAGFYPATAAFLLALVVLLKARPIWFAVLVAVLITFVVGYVFEELLRVVLPQGRLGLSF
ncbi:tripartite tricarboxylate transporter TctB family protein [Primorskyibacter sedentarius]|uniref:Tripartite tricarboxylate transporter TctB family protein n=1 Tax=Primorskyibacter sedentarius TaxID=745311 RepID=A0A4R3IT71_9RHOB|nr:tripartite tricarboxylate transporter TctB family protein [Primorskyibacter sedentarius]TCS53209.1 tripartite tricarboxylate transporter TctB family protein [Primorskyibacter sedentarius]